MRTVGGVEQRTISRYGEASRLPLNGGEEQRIISGQFQNKASLIQNLVLTAVYERNPEIQAAAAEALHGAGQDVVQELIRLFREAKTV